MVVTKAICATAMGLLGCVAAQCDEALPPFSVQSGDSKLEVRFQPGALDLPASKIEAWISNAAQAVVAYFGRFPAEQARILIRLAEGRHGVLSGTTYGPSSPSNGPFTRIAIGQKTTEEELDRDWMMTHELIHMAFPDLTGEGREHHWMEEGMATYVEPIARAQLGRLSPETVWADMVRWMPQGLPQAGDQGLDHTHTWGRTYWGGALFWLLADVRIREETGNRMGLHTALRGILDAGGSIAHEWPIERVLQVGDKAAGCSVLSDLYDQMKATPVSPDLERLWKRLGILVGTDGRVSFDPRAPLADVRQAITAQWPAHAP